MAQALDGILTNISTIWGWVWWIILPVFAISFFWQSWLNYIRYCFIVSLKWKTLEIKIPREILKTPKAMEQIFAAAHAPYSYGMRPTLRYWFGEVELWYSFEMVSIGGSIHFYVRLIDKLKNLIETAIYAQYPDAEITEVESYLDQYPETIPNEKQDLFGYEFMLRKPRCYPIRTYHQFEDPVEERRIDPVASIFEIMSKLGPDEHMFFQVVIRPAGDELEKEGSALIDEMTERKGKKQKTRLFPSPLFGVTFSEAVRSPVQHPGELKQKSQEPQRYETTKVLLLTPGERATIEAVEMKMSKLSFETTTRFVYIDNRKSFSKNNVAAMMGVVRQFNTEDLNAFKPDKLMSTDVRRGIFKKKRLEWRKHNMWYRYRYLLTNSHKPILNIEEIATIYHFPMMSVVAPRLERIESKKAGPPAGLPLVED